VDCDKDSFAATAAPSTQQCDEPPTPHSSCTGQSGGWTSKAPSGGDVDCWDKSALAKPMTATENNSAWQSSAISGAPVAVDFDYNCDGTEEKEGVLNNTWKVNVSTSASCGQCGFGGFGGIKGIDIPNAVGGTGGFGGIGGIGGGIPTLCCGDDGWTGSSRPACGSPGQFS